MSPLLDRPFKPCTRQLLIASAAIVLKLCVIGWIFKTLYPLLPTHNSSSNSYTGDDYPQTWNLGELESVLVSVEDTTLYQLSGNDAKVQWEALYPEEGLIYLGPEHRPFSISMFHQLHCLDIIRKSFAARQKRSDLGEASAQLNAHCLDYLRQMALCRADLDLSPVLGKPHPKAFPGVYECQNWDQVYAETRRNQEEHRTWLAG